MNLKTSRSARKIEDWLEARGYDLQPGVGYACFWEEKIITYRPHDTRDTTIFALLHECGHVLVSEAIKRETVGVRYKRGYPNERTGKARPNVSAADVVHEEIEAWHRGFMLARRLSIRINAERYWKDYGKCIKRYFRNMVDGVV